MNRIQPHSITHTHTQHSLTLSLSLSLSPSLSHTHTHVQLAHDMLYNTFQGNAATRWGNTHEPVACQEYVLSRRAQVCI